MKRSLILGLSVVLVLVMTALVGIGCGEGATDSEAPDAAGDTEATEATTDGGTGGSGALPEATPGSYVDLTPEQAKQLIDATPDLVILDVSSAYANGHLPGAINYYVGDGSLDAAIPSLDQTVPYLVYCHVDSAAIAGAQALVDAGFPAVYRLEGNYSAWVDAGYPVEK